MRPVISSFAADKSRRCGYQASAGRSHSDKPASRCGSLMSASKHCSPRLLGRADRCRFSSRGWFLGNLGTASATADTGCGRGGASRPKPGGGKGERRSTISVEAAAACPADQAAPGAVRAATAGLPSAERGRESGWFDENGPHGSGIQVLKAPVGIEGRKVFLQDLSRQCGSCPFPIPLFGSGEVSCGGDREQQLSISLIDPNGLGRIEQRLQRDDLRCVAFFESALKLCGDDRGLLKDAVAGRWCERSGRHGRQTAGQDEE